MCLRPIYISNKDPLTLLSEFEESGLIREQNCSLLIIHCNHLIYVWRLEENLDKNIVFDEVIMNFEPVNVVPVETLSSGQKRGGDLALEYEW